MRDSELPSPSGASRSPPHRADSDRRRPGLLRQLCDGIHFSRRAPRRSGGAACRVTSQRFPYRPAVRRPAGCDTGRHRSAGRPAFRKNARRAYADHPLLRRVPPSPATLCCCVNFKCEACYITTKFKTSCIVTDPIGRSGGGAFYCKTAPPDLPIILHSVQLYC